MKIYTKTGDNGFTSLFGGDRVSKDNLRIEAYGSVDELNSILGVAFTETVESSIKEIILRIQNLLFVLGADLATPLHKDRKVSVPRISEVEVSEIEEQIDIFESKIPELKSFILPGGSKGSAYLHLARTVCRRAERKTVTLGKTLEIGDYVVIFLNRLSDLLFVMARFENYFNKTPDIKWEK